MDLLLSPFAVGLCAARAADAFCSGSNCLDLGGKKNLLGFLESSLMKGARQDWSLFVSDRTCYT